MTHRYGLFWYLDTCWNGNFLPIWIGVQLRFRLSHWLVNHSGFGVSIFGCHHHVGLMSTWQSDKVFETKVGFVRNILFLGHFNWQSRNEKHGNWNYYPRKEFQRWIEFRPQHGTERRKQVLETWKFSQGSNSRPFCAIMTLISPLWMDGAEEPALENC